MSKKKIIYISILAVLIIGIIVFFVVWGQSKKEQQQVAKQNEAPAPALATAEATPAEESAEPAATSPEPAPEAQPAEASNVQADVVLGDKYFDTQIADINTNFSKYEGKTIELEGLYFENGKYTFVGRYTTSNLCPDCPAGVTYLEYEWDSANKPQLIKEDSWLKVKGQLAKGDDQGQEYHYIKVSDLQVMPEKGQTTVNN